ncbi:PaaX family transcriptional regulator C-terminal domain-containing protein [Paenibacillus hamazuiensis]|uniref:PaaX family transcriptional regulator C-terminal domain-containing protein n=1 Tax=Paenibacillus hamazuiensis TaxID=2936508 RepID=UPI00200F4F4D|nr:PaaX family transcriptional regulator C-terminal domain-containing protein [Paenibacillus hamazuiensis]
MLSIDKQVLFLLSRADDLEPHELIRIYERRGYSAPYIRNALSRLKKERYVDSPSRSIYRITDAGRAFIRSINRKPGLYGQIWDGKWHLVLAEFPEALRRKRDQFRADLLQTGFGLLHGGVYLAPWPYQAEVAELIAKHDAAEQVTVFRGAGLEGSGLSPEAAAGIWRLGDVAAAYGEKERWLVSEFEPVVNRIFDGEPEPLDVFVAYLQLGEAISELYLIDPMLPDELLPAAWPARGLLSRMNDLAERLIRAIPDNSYYARFVRGN